MPWIIPKTQTSTRVRHPAAVIPKAVTFGSTVGPEGCRVAIVLYLLCCARDNRLTQIPTDRARPNAVQATAAHIATNPIRCEDGPMTYSILGFDPSNGDLGVAVQSKFPGVGSLVPYGEAGVGVVATQAFANPRHGSVGLSLLKCGATPQQAVDILRNGDDQMHKRQFALLDSNGEAADYTGADLVSWDGWSGSATGDCCLAIGNGL